MQIVVNEENFQVEAGSSLFELRDRQKPNADLVIVNGYPVDEDQKLKDGDRVVLLCHGEQPTATDLEALMRARHTPGVHEKIKNSCEKSGGVV
jgi:sulfur carrier protein ThiS adenylyltransferase